MRPISPKLRAVEKQLAIINPSYTELKEGVPFQAIEGVPYLFVVIENEGQPLRFLVGIEEPWEYPQAFGLADERVVGYLREIKEQAAVVLMNVLMDAESVVFDAPQRDSFQQYASRYINGERDCGSQPSHPLKQKFIAAWAEHKAGFGHPTLGCQFTPKGEINLASTCVVAAGEMKLGVDPSSGEDVLVYNDKSGRYFAGTRETKKAPLDAFGVMLSRKGYCVKFKAVSILPEDVWDKKLRKAGVGTIGLKNVGFNKLCGIMANFLKKPLKFAIGKENELYKKIDSAFFLELRQSRLAEEQSAGANKERVLQLLTKLESILQRFSEAGEFDAALGSSLHQYVSFCRVKISATFLNVNTLPSLLFDKPSARADELTSVDSCARLT